MAPRGRERGPYPPGQNREAVVAPTGPVAPVNNVFMRYSLPGRMRYRRLPLKRPLRDAIGDDARFD